MTNEMKRTAENVARMIMEDKASESYINGTDADRNDFCIAYMQAWFKKVEKMQTILLTNPEAKKEFSNLVASL